MKYLLLAASVIIMLGQNVASKQYNIKNETKNMRWFSACTAMFATIVYVVCSGFKLDLQPEVIPYSLGFAAAFCTALVGYNSAVKNGPLSISALILSCSLIIPTLYGIIFQNNPVTTFSYIGFVFLFASLVLVNLKKEKMSFNKMWLPSIIVAFAGNGMCSVVQNMQQVAQEGKYKSESMFLAMLVAAIVLIILGFFQKDEHKLQTFVRCIPYGALYGIVNGVVNFLILIMIDGLLPASVIFPTISAGSIALTFALSTTIYRERLTRVQYIGYAFGIVSVILLNL